MFGFQGGESRETVARKREYLKSAQREWSYLTYYDLSTIKNQRQLSTIVRTRYHLDPAQADLDVANWMKGKDFTSGLKVVERTP